MSDVAPKSLSTPSMTVASRVAATPTPALQSISWPMPQSSVANPDDRTHSGRTGPGTSPSSPTAEPSTPTDDEGFDPDILRRLLPPYRVVVVNNDHNTFDEVITVLVRAVAGMSRATAEAHANEIHQTGSTVPYVGPLERAEAVAAVIRTIGILVRVEPDA
ncbi:MAG: ATP-dependent Clp protease adaptor ClpS [Chloroflexi bacterium]|nr:ATP-dependent Clp protease adaptor ClpS [Chloroflexota bacterium]